MQTQLAISVIVPAFNEEKLIANCLSSLKNQDFVLPYEVIVVNNNSTDKTAEIALTFGVKVITETIPSVVFARQRGLTEAKGEIVVGADCDCVYPPGYLSSIYKHFSDPKVVAAGGPAVAEKDPFWAHLIYKLGFAIFSLVYKLTGYVSYLGGFNFAFRRETFLKLGGYRTYLDFGGDELDPLQRLKKVGKVVYDPQAFMYISLRRYRVGFFKWFFVHNLYYYMFNYALARTFKRTFIRAQPVRNI